MLSPADPGARVQDKGIYSPSALPAPPTPMCESASRGSDPSRRQSRSWIHQRQFRMKGFHNG